MNRTQQYLKSLIFELKKLPKETPWVEFKENNKDPQEIGEYISALSNSAALNGKVSGYLVWGIRDETHEVVGTSFSPHKSKKGNEELESWLLRMLSPRINFSFHYVDMEGENIILLEVERTSVKPVQFSGQEYIRVGTNKKNLKGYPEIERDLWRIFDKTLFEDMIALENIEEVQVLKLLDYPAYFDLVNMALPEQRSKIIDRLAEDDMINKSETGKWNITNLGAILFAKKLSDFKRLKRKTVRIIVYKANSRIETQREQESVKGYATDFENLIAYIDNLLPRNEVIGKALRKDVPMYPELAVRELVANAIIHQDFSIGGTGPTIEIFSDRMEITNPGTPLVEADRFLDSPPKSRNEALASFMRRIGVCEERGSGFDKVVNDTEVYQLPAPQIAVYDEHTKVNLYSYKSLKEMDRDEKLRACYLHSCLKYVNGEKMNNSSLRERFGLEEKDSSVSSRIIRDTVEANLIKQYNPDTAPRYMQYIPYWA